MSAAAWTFAAFFVITLFLFAILWGEREHLTAQRDLAEAERADLDDVLRMLLAERPPAQVLPFGPVQSGVVKRIPRQRNGEGA